MPFWICMRGWKAHDLYTCGSIGSKEHYKGGSCTQHSLNAFVKHMLMLKSCLQIFRHNIFTVLHPLECISSRCLPRSLGQILGRRRHLMPPRWLEIESKYFSLSAWPLNGKLLEAFWNGRVRGYFKMVPKNDTLWKFSLVNEKKKNTRSIYVNFRNVRQRKEHFINDF